MKDFFIVYDYFTQISTLTEQAIDRLFAGRLWRTHVGQISRRQVQAVRGHQLGHWVCGEESAGSLHENIKVQRLDQPNYQVLNNLNPIYIHTRQ